MRRKPTILWSPQDRHRPPHQTDRGDAIFLTASTVRRIHHLAGPDRKDSFWDLLCTQADEHQINLVAWVILDEHYHLIVRPEAGPTIDLWLNTVHSESALAWNREDQTPGRQVWYQYWDRSLWTDGDLWSRINYIHGNPVKHGYVNDPGDWRWSSYSMLDDDPNFRELRHRFPAPKRIPDDDF